MTDDNPSKALALSFHGQTGTGKNFVSRIIAKNIYKEGIDSKFVHLISSANEFPHKDMLTLYKDKLKQLIEDSVMNCERSMFIFDEIDKMPHKLIDTIIPYLNYYEKLNGVNYRKAIFIFISNTAGLEITKVALEAWQADKARESIELEDMEKLITKTVVNSDTSAFYHSDLSLRQMITVYIPFLPLERKHVRRCIKDYLLQKKYYSTTADIKDEKVREIADKLIYYPDDENLFSSTGCKRVAEKANYVMDDD